MTKLTDYFLPILKEDPASAEVISHKLMLRAGMIRQQSAGVYVWLPLGLKVLKKVEQIVREEMNRAGALEVLMPCIQPASLWNESGRYDSYGKEMLRITDRHEHQLLFGPTNEEVITDIFRNNVKSYKELPKNFYHIQWKFRDEIRPRFGLMRGREFYMKDAYSFDADEESAQRSYDNMFSAYLKIFKRLGLGSAIPVRADTGAIGGNLSHEFHIIADTGESDIFYDVGIEEEVAKPNPDITKLKSMYAMADDMHKPKECQVPNERLRKHKSIEVGHVFYFGTKYSKAMKAFFMSNSGEQTLPHGGSYGIGVSRLVAAVIEASHDAKGIIWPNAVAPFQVSLLNLNVEDRKCVEVCDEIYTKLDERNIDVLYDDAKATAGYKFATHELIGVPLQIIVGPKLAQQNKAELKYRATGEVKQLEVQEILSSIRA